ncbi:MAG: hypothetical protein ACK4K7_13010 [Allosphingosinicella sp.]|uniref:hypothetical protein n=1 Tax=Allosphingosinicella sp. TaxID=2823234 RepID=UPI0039441494
MLTIILPNAALIFAFPVGATYDWSALIARSDRLNRLAWPAMNVSSALLVVVVLSA